jgi:hypothetical protein
VGRVTGGAPPDHAMEAFARKELDEGQGLGNTEWPRGQATCRMMVYPRLASTDLDGLRLMARFGDQDYRGHKSVGVTLQTSDMARIAAEAHWKKQQREGACSFTRPRGSEVRFRGHTGNHFLMVSLTASDRSRLQAHELLLEGQTTGHDVGGRRRASLHVYTLTRQAG